MHAKVLVGADGYFSKIRQLCLDDGPPQFAVRSKSIFAAPAVKTVALATVLVDADGYFPRYVSCALMVVLLNLRYVVHLYVRLCYNCAAPAQEQISICQDDC